MLGTLGILRRRTAEKVLRCRQSAGKVSMLNRHKYYLLGYIFADGCLCTSTKGYDYIQIATIDSDIAYKIAELTGTTVGKFKTKWKIRYTISIWDRELVNWFKSKGIIKRKTGKEIYPEVELEFLPHFIRGYMDGDGMITIFKNLLLSGFACASKDFLLNLRRDLSYHAGISKDSGTLLKENDAECFKLRYAIRDTIRICRYIYKDADIFMERKKNNYLAYVRDIAPQRLCVQGRAGNRWAKIKSELYSDVKSIPKEEYQYLKEVL
jgi:hypothetical protein